MGRNRWLVALLVLSVVGCGGAKKSPQQVSDERKVDQALSQIPDWYMNPPTDANFMYGTGTNDSRDLQMAKDGAEHAARVSIANATEAKVSALFKSFMEQTGAAEDEELLRMNTNVSKSVANEVIAGTRVSKQAVMNENGRFRVYVLLEMPLGEAGYRLRDRLRAQQNAYTRFRASQGFQELEQEVAAFEKWKKEQGTGTPPAVPSLGNAASDGSGTASGQ